MMTLWNFALTLFRALFYWVEAIFLFFIPRRFRFKDVSNDIVLITGGGNGFGQMLAMRFTQLGSTVVLWDIDESNLLKTKNAIRKFGGLCYCYTCDVSNRSNVYSTAKKVKEEVGDVTILINNAGIVFGKPFFELDDENIVKIFNVNTLSHFWTCKAFMPSMREKGRGHIVSVASLAGLTASPNLTDYSATKFASVGFQESLWLETYFNNYENINFTTVCPFYMNTALFSGVSSEIIGILDPEYAAEEVIKAILTNQNIVIVPRFFYILYALKSFLPSKTLLALYDFFGVQRMMASRKNQ
ncbi:epidermal retinol dehydrogenase 2-like protein [Dinothrombium tinctorium]|uniref:Short-chain dehydrogenase/reductase 3 n=1 Tax=Dinothrombium tinctorium TaxID=1965070 RepID=A0A3S3P268_9ACAR|nr:epidermal retinol dehydrogenase 2-like protein [Dinothrombium tinctorium]